MGVRPIEQHGVIGDLHTAALVAADGTLDWLCLPRFDSPSVFAALLDEQRGGWFRVTPAVPFRSRQLYWPDTNVLITRFFTADGMADLVDFMPVGQRGPWRGEHLVVRRIRVLRGAVPFEIECRPAFDYARQPHTLRREPHGVCFEAAGLRLGLSASVALEPAEGAARARAVLTEGQSLELVLQTLPPDQGCAPSPTAAVVNELFHHTVRYWRHWLAGCTYRGRWREMVRRSALVLKLLTYEPTGAIVAAPTAALPEFPGGDRNWDYRYTWVRDAAFTVYALMRIGFHHEAVRFVRWIEQRCAEAGPGPLQPVYGIDGRRDLTEQTLDHLAGYAGSRPVRIGNDAFRQRQLDVYGELMDAIYLFNKHVEPISDRLWKDLRRLLDWLVTGWQQPDCGIWESRGVQRHYVHSRVMCWVALDRGLRLAEKRSLPADRERWRAARDAIYEEVHSRGWNPARRAFVQFYGTDRLDAACLMFPLVFFVSPTDPQMLETLAALMRPTAEGGLMAGDLLKRYHTGDGADGFTTDEGAFTLCSFWLVEALCRAGRTQPHRLEQARLLFENLLGYASPLGLYAEQVGPSGEALGNFPQALTHLALITAAVNLDRSLGENG
jgi:GH15 family glucan-1,4-alpha-glucosidase